MTDYDRVKIYQQALREWGSERQLFMVIEEMAEVIKELCHFQRGRLKPICLANELADAIIMAEQLVVVIHHKAYEADQYDGDLDRFIGGIDEAYLHSKKAVLLSSSRYTEQQSLARVISIMWQIMALADGLLIGDMDIIEHKYFSKIRTLIPALWIMLDEVASYVFQDVFHANGSLPVGKSFANILQGAGRQKLAHLEWLIGQDEEGENESGKQ